MPFPVFVLVLARLMGIFLCLPTLRACSAMSLRSRVGWCLILAVLISPVCPSAATEGALLTRSLFLLVVQEAVMGLVLGIGLHVLFLGVPIAGQMICQASGLTLTGAMGVGTPSSAPLVRFFDLLAWAVFLVIGGHRMVMDMLLASFRELPPGSPQFSTDTLECLTTLLTRSFSLGLRAALPILGALFVSAIMSGVLMRTIPQLNGLVLSMSLNSFMLLMSLFVGLSGMVWIFQEEVGILLDDLIRCMLVGTGR